MMRPAYRVLAVVVLATIAGWGALRGRGPLPATAGEDEFLVHGVFRERAMRDEQIGVWERARTRDPSSALVLGQLAGLRLQRSREGGGWSDVIVAESLARRSLARREAHNAATRATLVASLVAQHRFRDAEREAHRLVALAPDALEYRAMLGEVAMEGGNYALAEEAFAAAWPERAQLSIAPRTARWLELRGSGGAARRLLEAAVDSAMARQDLPREAKAWFAFRLGEFEMREGRPHRARAAYRRGLAIEPWDPRLNSAMAGVAASSRDWRGTLAWGERALVGAPDPDVLLLLAVAHEALGDEESAQRMREAFDAAISSAGGPFHRTWALALLDRGERVEELLARARRELDERPDVYGQDLLAWALLKAGQPEAAATVMREARRLGTRDVLLERHQRVIDAAVARRGDE